MDKSYPPQVGDRAEHPGQAARGSESSGGKQPGKSAKGETRKERVKGLIAELQSGVHGRDEAIAVSLLAALAGQNVFLLGPPGTAKSLIARQLASAFEAKAFEYLMHRFSTPEDIFGPVSLKKLKEKDVYERDTEGYLPNAEVAFLDEIWKSGPAILNTLLTIINEKRYRNGSKMMEDLPLKVLISASNETPRPGEGLEALYDRFLARIKVEPAQGDDFDAIIDKPKDRAASKPGMARPILPDEFEAWEEGIDEVKLSQETRDIIWDLRHRIEEANKKLKQDGKPPIYVSDRRWHWAAQLLRAAAFFCDRKETNLVDALLLRYCLWSEDAEHRQLTERMVAQAVEDSDLPTDISVADLEKEQDRLEKAINTDLYHADNVYDTETLLDGTGAYFKKRVRLVTGRHFSSMYVKEAEDCYIPEAHRGTRRNFSPFDGQGQRLEHILYNFNGSDSYTLKAKKPEYRLCLPRNGNLQEKIKTEPKPRFLKGAIIKPPNESSLKRIRRAAEGLREKTVQAIVEIEAKRAELRGELDSPFVVSKDLRNIPLRGAKRQLEEAQSILEECLRAEDKIKRAWDARGE